MAIKVDLFVIVFFSFSTENNPMTSDTWKGRLHEPKGILRSVTTLDNGLNLKYQGGVWERSNTNIAITLQLVLLISIS